MTELIQPIPARLKNVAVGGHVAGADQIIDDEQNKTQEQINAEVLEAIGTGGSVDTKITNAINALDATASKTAGADGLALSVTEENGKITAINGSIAANTYDAHGAAAAVVGNAGSDYNTLKKIEDKLFPIETAVGTGGSIDQRIEDATEDCAYLGEDDGSETIADFDPQADSLWKEAQVLSSAEKAQVKTNLGLPQEIYSKTEVNNLVTTPNQQYVTVATYASLPASGSADTVYRVSNYNGATSQVDSTVYSEYAWNGTAYEFLCVKSQVGEVFDISAYNSNTKYADLAAALGTNGANVPEGLRKGGMSVKFVSNSDNKYVQYLYVETSTSVANFTNTDNWEKVNLNQEVNQTKQELISYFDKPIAHEVGSIDADTGKNVPNQNRSRTAGYIYLLNGLSIKHTASGFVSTVLMYDENYNFLGYFETFNNITSNDILNSNPLTKYVRLVDQSSTSFRFEINTNGLYEYIGKIAYGKQNFYQLPNPVNSILEPINTTFEDGIFGEQNEGFKTSDYIEVNTDNGDIYYWIRKMAYSASYDKIRFYDKDYVQIGSIRGGVGKNDVPFILNFPFGTKYIKFSSYGTRKEIYKAPAIDFDSAVKKITEQVFAPTNNLVWIGTSIPQGASYPINASQKCGYNCLNKSKGSSSLCFNGQHPETVQYYSGLKLTATVAELEALYRADVTNGVITEAQLDEWKNYSYERSIIPHINGTDSTQISLLVIDHGFNDRDTIHSLMQDVEHIDWTSRDRSNFVGAFNYLLDKIWEVNPFFKIIIAGYFQDKLLVPVTYYSKEICQMQELLSEHFSIQLMPAWKYTQITNDFIEGTSNYLADFNAQYGTSYTPMATDGDGNIKSFQIYCPDGVHPDSDKSGRSNARLDAVYAKLLRDSI